MFNNTSWPGFVVRWQQQQQQRRRPRRHRPRLWLQRPQPEAGRGLEMF